MAYATCTESALQRQRQRGRDDAMARNAFGHHDESMSYAPGPERRAAKEAYRTAWERARSGR